MTRRIYDGCVLADWDVDPWAAVCPPDEETRRKWGWKQDEKGHWYREIPFGGKIGDLPANQGLLAIRVLPSGEEKCVLYGPEAEARIEKNFRENFDPVTLERLSIKRIREAGERLAKERHHGKTKPPPSS